jgi:hypothetical protein
MLVSACSALIACDGGGEGSPNADARPDGGAIPAHDSAASATTPDRNAASSDPVAPVSRTAAPARPFELTKKAREGTSADGTYVVRWEPVDGVFPDAEPFDIRCEVLRADGKPLAKDASVFVDAEMPHHGHGMNLVPTVAPAGAGKFLASGMLLHMPGKWVIAIDVEEGGIAERTQWYVDIE